MSGERRISKLSIAEYLKQEEKGQIRHEFVNGRIFEMSGGTLGHNTICLNIATSLRERLKGSKCNVYMSDVKVHCTAVNSFYYPDVVVDCGKGSKQDVYTETPTMIFEVLSKSTASTDRREKLVAYQSLPSLQDYVLVHQTKKRVEHYRKVDEDWVLQDYTEGEEISFAAKSKELSLKISMDEIYADLDFETSPSMLVREDVELYAW